MFGFFFFRMLADSHYMHAQRGCSFCNMAANAAQTYKPQRRTREFARTRAPAP